MTLLIFLLLTASISPSTSVNQSLYSNNHLRSQLTSLDEIPSDYLLRYYVNQALAPSPSDVIYVTEKMKHTFPKSCVNYHRQSWEEFMIAVKTNCSDTNTPSVVVTFHQMIGDILLSLHKYRKKRKKSVTEVLDELAVPIVILAFCDQNWGFLSTIIPNRTAPIINLTNHLRTHQSNHQTINNFLDSSKVVALFVNAHVDPMIPRNEKIISIPLGIARIQLYQRILSLPYVNKTRLLVINNSGWKFRSGINAMVSKAFNYTVTNEYYRMKSRGTEEWRIQVMSSKFVLCPSGFSFDSYRIWETLMMGSIPIVESNPSGLDRIFSTLPVLIVRSFSVLTPEYLEKAYPCFITHAAKYNFHLLQASYWRSLVNETMTTGTRKKINENHPFYHRYCNYLSP